MNSVQLGEALKATVTSHPHLRRLDTAKMLAQTPPDTQWVCEPIAARGHLTMLAGREKEGKSLLMQAVGVAMCDDDGGEVGGMTVRPGKYTSIDAENGELVVWRRTRGLELPFGAEDRFVTYEVAGMFDLRDCVDEVAAVLEAERPDLLVLDSFRSLWGGKENETDEAASVLEPLLILAREYNVAIVLLHHKGKADDSPYRGSTAIGSTVECIASLGRVRDDPEPLRRRLTTRCRFDEDRTVWLKIEADQALGILAIDGAEPFIDPDKPKASPRNAALKLELWWALDPMTERTLAEICVSVRRGPKDGTVRRYLEKLTLAGHAIRGDTGYRRGAKPDWVAPGTGGTMAPGTTEAAA